MSAKRGRGRPKMEVTKARARKALKELVEIINTINYNPVTPSARNASALREIVTSLRGPDNDAYEIKKQTTARIRGAIGLLSPSGLHISLIPPPAASDVITDGNWQMHHMSHYQRAWHGLKRLGYVKDVDK